MDAENLYRKDSHTRMTAEEYAQALREESGHLYGDVWRERVGLWERDEENRLPLPEYLAAFDSPSFTGQAVWDQGV